MFAKLAGRWLVASVPVAVLAMATIVTAEDPHKPAAAAAKGIVDTLKDAGNFKTLARLLDTAGLTETLKGKGPFTLFAPTDEAFAKVDKATMADWEKTENKGKLADLLKHHVVSGKSMAADVAKMKTAKAMAGDEIAVSVKDGKTMLDGATVVKADMAADNGVIHSIDAVLMAKAPAAKPAETKKEEPKKEEPKKGDKK